MATGRLSSRGILNSTNPLIRFLSVTRTKAARERYVGLSFLPLLRPLQVLHSGSCPMASPNTTNSFLAPSKLVHTISMSLCIFGFRFGPTFLLAPFFPILGPSIDFVLAYSPTIRKARQANLPPGSYEHGQHGQHRRGISAYRRGEFEECDASRRVFEGQR